MKMTEEEKKAAEEALKQASKRDPRKGVSLNEKTADRHADEEEKSVSEDALKQAEYDLTKQELFEKLESDGSVRSVDFDVWESTIKGKKHLVAFVAPDEVAWEMFETCSKNEQKDPKDQVDTKNVQLAMLKRCLAFPKPSDLDDLLSKKPALRSLFTKLVQTLALGGITSAKK